MTSEQLKELETRCHRAIQFGYVLGRGDQLAAMLMGECGPIDASPDRHGSAQHLLRIIQAIRDLRSGKVKRAPEPVKAPPPKPVEPVKAPEPEKVPEPEKAPEPVEPEPPKAEGKKGKSKRG